MLCGQWGHKVKVQKFQILCKVIPHVWEKEAEASHLGCIFVEDSLIPVRGWDGAGGHPQGTRGSFQKTGGWAVIVVDRLCPLQSQPLSGRGGKGGEDQES